MNHAIKSLILIYLFYSMDKKYDIETMTDVQIVEAILERNSYVTTEYLYKKCYPLFNDIFKRFYTDCENCTEFVNEIYLYIVMPPSPSVKKKPEQDSSDSEESKKCKLAKFGFRCSLTMWLKIVTLNYCRQLYAKRIQFLSLDEVGDMFTTVFSSLMMESNSTDMQDITTLLDLMPNQRYRTLIEYRHVSSHTDSETAEYLKMKMPNYYNKHRLAKAQFVAVLRKEGL